MRILVTGGAGYIGSHCVVELCRAGLEPVIFDNFSTSKRAVIDRLRHICEGNFFVVEGDVLDAAALGNVIEKFRPGALIHFAGFKSVAESASKPLDYYETNVRGTLIALKQAVCRGVKKFVLSSSATVYGSYTESPVTESAPKIPLSPYGRTKAYAEEIIADACVADAGLAAVSLRYFNPVGAHASGFIGEDPDGEPGNLMPLICQVAAGLRSELSVFGDDYATPDGTGLRDFIHVCDLARGHVAALRFLENRRGHEIFNLGTGRPYSVREVIAAFEGANHVSVPARAVGRRPGDVAECWANVEKASRLLHWRAEQDLESMCRTAWNWQKLCVGGRPKI